MGKPNTGPGLLAPSITLPGPGGWALAGIEQQDIIIPGAAGQPFSAWAMAGAMVEVMAEDLGIFQTSPSASLLQRKREIIWRQ